MFQTITFWCEFPETTNWENINKLINFKANIYIASNSKQEFLNYKNKIKNKNIQTIGAWPTIKKEQGYWFSSYTIPEYIKKLKEFRNIPIKIDLEAPIFKGKSTNLKAIRYFLKYFILKKGKYKGELKETIESLNQPIILSTFPMPDSALNHIGYFKNTLQHNFFIYTSLISKPFQPILRIYYKKFVKSKLKENPNTMFAIGCTGPGIFQNEGFYKNIKEFKRDLKMIKNLNVKNAVIFELSSLSNKKDAKEWFSLIATYLNLL